MRAIKNLSAMLPVVCIFFLSALTASAQSTDTQPGIPQGPMRVSGGVIAGNLIKRVIPNYPMYAKEHGITGAVVLHAIIGKDGSVKNLEAVSGPDTLKQSALDAVKHWKYKPFLLNGEPTEIDTTITVNFDLNRRR